MKASRRPVLFAILGLLLAGPVAAQDAAFPAKPVRIIIPAAPGGSADKNARAIADKLGEAWKQPVIVEYKPGANTVIGTDYVAKSAGDGHTLLLNSAAIVVNPAIYAKLPFDTVNDLVPVTMVSTAPFALVVHPSVPARNAREFVDLARSRPELLSFGTAESRALLVGHQFNLITHAKLASVPFKGAGALMNDLVAGHVPVAFSALSSVRAHVESGRLRLLGIASAKPSALAPEVPALASAEIPGFEAASWFGLFAPKGTPPDVVAKIHRDVAAVLKDPSVARRFEEMGAQPTGEPPQAFSARVRDEIAMSAKVARAANLKAE